VSGAAGEDANGKELKEEGRRERVSRGSAA
jgi:hypothetical protein